MRRDRRVLLDELRGEGLVAERAAGQPRQLAVMAVVEDREELPVAGEVVGQPGAGQRVGDRVGGEARLALLAVGDDRLAGRLQAPDRVLGGGVLLGLQLLPCDLALVVVRVGLLQLHRPRQRPDELSGNGHASSPSVERRSPAAQQIRTDRSPSRFNLPRRRLPRQAEAVSSARDAAASNLARISRARRAASRSPSAAATRAPAPAWNRSAGTSSAAQRRSAG